MITIHNRKSTSYRFTTTDRDDVAIANIKANIKNHNKETEEYVEASNGWTDELLYHRIPLMVNVKPRKKGDDFTPYSGNQAHMADAETFDVYVYEDFKKLEKFNKRLLALVVERLERAGGVFTTTEK